MTSRRKSIAVGLCAELVRISRANPALVAATLVTGAATAALFAVVGVATLVNDSSAHRAYCLAVTSRHIVFGGDDYPLHCIVGERKVDMEQQAESLPKNFIPVKEEQTQ